MIQASIIIPTRNRADCLEENVNSFLKQNFPKENYEILIIDNGSTDTTPEISQRLILDNSEFNIRYIHEPIAGLLSGRHRGIKESNSEILCFVDDDIIANVDWLSSIVSSFENPEVHLVGGPSVGRFDVSLPFWMNQFTRDIQSGGSYLGELSLIHMGEEEKFIPAHFVFGLNFSIRKSTVIECGGFHPDCIPKTLQRYQGDGETGLSYKITAKGYKTLYQPKAHVEHMTPASRMNVSYIRTRYYYQGVCDSYTAIRSGTDLDSIPIPVNPLEVSPTIEDAAKFYSELILYEAKKAYREGFQFHLNEVKSDPKLYQWVVRSSYIEDYNYL